MSRTASLLQAFVGGFRRLDLFARVAGAAGALALLFGGAAWGARLGWFDQPWWVLVTWAIGIIGVGILAALYHRGQLRLSAGWLAAELEALGFRRGALGGLLEAPASGTSPMLLEMADQRQAVTLSEQAPPLLTSLRAPFRRRVVQGGATLLAGAALLLSARPTHGHPALLWHPVEAWSATVAPLRVVLSADEVQRGGLVQVQASARGRTHAILWVRAPGESWRGTGLALDSLGRASTTLGPLENDLFIRLTSGSRSSDTLQVRVLLPAFLGALAVTARYPRYLALEDEAVPTDGDTVIVPEGTMMETTGEATTPLTSAAWQAGASRASLAVDGSRFRGRFTPVGNREWTLTLATLGGVPLAGDTIHIPIRTVADSAPRVDVPVPGADTIIPLTLRVPLVIDAQDDHGLTRLLVESRRISRLGFEDPARVETVELPGSTPDRAVLPWQLDLNGRGLVPGDSVRFIVRAVDNAPAAHTGRSREYALRLPTLSEVREAARQTASEIGQRLDSIAAASRKLERQTEDLAQERPRQGAQQNGGTEESLSFENAKRAEAVAAAEQELQKQAELTQQMIESLRQNAEAAGLSDPAWQARLEEVQKLLERAMTPELRERLAELQQALKDLDPERTREALEKLAEAQQQMREALEQSRELFKRAALEGDMANLQAEAKDLAQAERQWTQQVPAIDTARAAREQESLAQRADSLGAALEQLSEDLGAANPEQQKAVADAAEQARQAAQKMQQAGKSASQGKRAEAKQQGEEASKQLEPLSDELAQQRDAMAERMRNEVMEALDRALGDVGRLAERQLAVSEAMRRGDTSPQVRSEQGAIEEGVERVLEQTKETAGKNALVSNQSSVALAAGRDRMRRAREALANAAPNSREASAQAGEAVDALNAAAYTLLRSRGQVEGSGSGSGMQEAMEQMAQMAAQQGQVGQQSGGLLPRMGQGGSAMQEQLRQLGAQQRALAERLDRMRAGGQIPGAAELAQEAKELARSLEAGRLDRQTVERQERLFRRMLDAGRTLQGQEEDEKQERQSTAGNEDSLRLPPALRTRLDPGDALRRVPSWEELQRLTPDERRQVIEYFRRLAEHGGNGEAGTGNRERGTGNGVEAEQR